MKDKLNRFLPYIWYGCCGIGVVILFFGLVAIVCDGFISLTMYARVFGMSAKQVYEFILIIIALGFVAGMIIKHQEVKRDIVTYGKIYVDPHGNQYEIIQGVKDKDGVPYIIAIDYPDKENATAYTLNFFNLMFKEKD